MTLKTDFGKCSLFVFSADGRKDQNMASSFSRQIWRIDWPILLQYGAKAKYWLIFAQAFAKQTKNHARLYPFDKTNQIALFLLIRLFFCFVGAFSFQGHTKIDLYITTNDWFTLEGHSQDADDN